MANLQKIVKVTQQQYNILKSGGTVGSYTGLNDNYVYLIEDTNIYITSNGGTIDGGNLDFYNGQGIAEFDDNDNVFAGFCINYYGDEIIYNSDSNYRHLFADDNYPLIYSYNSNYWSDFTFNTKELRILDGADTGGLLVFNAEDGTISRNNQYSYGLPNASGTLALTSQIPDDSNLVHKTGAETITGVKTFKDILHINVGSANWWFNTDSSGQFYIGTDANNNKVKISTTNTAFDTNLNPWTTNTNDLGSSTYAWKDLYLSEKIQYAINTSITYDSNNKVLILMGENGIIFNTSSNPIQFNRSLTYSSDNTKDIGTSTVRTRNFYLAGNLSDGTNSITVAEVVAKQDAVQVKRYI